MLDKWAFIDKFREAIYSDDDTINNFTTVITILRRQKSDMDISDIDEIVDDTVNKVSARINWIDTKLIPFETTAIDINKRMIAKINDTIQKIKQTPPDQQTPSDQQKIKYLKNTKSVFENELAGYQQKLDSLSKIKSFLEKQPEILNDLKH